MNRFEAWTVHTSNILVGVTGLIYAWMRYLMEPVDLYAVVNHPLQPFMQHLHIWTAPALVFGAGLIWRAHIWNHFKQGVKLARRSGLALVLSLTPMVLSGYLIQTTVSESWRGAWIVIHLVTSGLWVLGYVGHVQALLAWQKKRNEKEAAAPSLAALDAS